FGLPRADTGGIRTRLNILKAAGLIVERANWRYQVTPLGEAIALEYPLQKARDDLELSPSQAAEINNPGDLSSLAEAQQLAQELISAGTNSDNSILLEQTVARAFQFLGFQAQHHGGSGKTDITMT